MENEPMADKSQQQQRAAPLPVGTQVVTRIDLPGQADAAVRPAGAVGVVIAAPASPSGDYRVAFPDGGETVIAGHALAVRKLAQRAGLEPESAAFHGDELDAFIIYRCVVGSRAYGLDEPGSDTDRRGIYLPPARLHWSLAGVPEQIERHATQETYWELQKFLTLALKANPNVLECLHTPLVERATPLAEELLAMRHIFLSKLVYQTYNGYVLSQFKKLEQDLRTRGEIRWKHAMHLVRLLLSGITVLQEGVVPLRVEAQREILLAIRRSEVPWAEVDAWRRQLHRDFDAAYARTRLPERPDYERADAFLLKARREMARRDLEAAGDG
jgi:hypothetical protein